MDRRKFISSVAVLGAGAALLDAKTMVDMAGAPSERRRRKKKSGDKDENLVCIISDLHCNPDEYQEAKLRRTVADILTLDPLPANVLALGDVAYLQGRHHEYVRLKEIVSPIEAAGIKLTMAMGNHDRRKQFSEVFPEKAAESLVKDRLVFLVETPRADIIVLDSLQESYPDPDVGIVPGAIDDAQKAWLQDTLNSYSSKPVFVTAHHALNETGIKAMLVDSPTCCGYIHGHLHYWQPGWFRKNYNPDNRIIRSLCVPSTGHWGDIGYTLLKLGEESATAYLHQYEFFFPRPLAEGQEKPILWSMIEEEHAGVVCKFAYNK